MTKTDVDQSIAIYFGKPLAEIKGLRQAAEIALAQGYRLGVEDAARIMREEWANGPGSVSGSDVTLDLALQALNNGRERIDSLTAKDGEEG